MIRGTVYKECVSNLSKEHIIRESERNNEYPFGYVIDYLKDNYGLSKIEGYEIAENVCAFFGV